MVLFKLAWRNIWRNKRRSLITIGMVLLAVLLSSLMRSLQLGTYDRMIDGLVKYTTGYLQVSGKGFQDDPVIDNSISYAKGLHDSLLSIDGIEAVSPRLNGIAFASHKSKTDVVEVSGIRTDIANKTLQFNKKLVKGELLDSSDYAVLIGEGLADKMDLEPGDSLVLLGQGYHAQTAAGLFPIKGILRFPNPVLNDRSVFVGLHNAQEFYGAPGLISSYTLDIEMNTELTDLQAKVENLISGRPLEAANWMELNKELYQGIQGDSAGGIIMMFILYMLIVFGVFGTIVMMTAERQYEFGVLISVGMRRYKLGAVVLYETIIMGLIGVLSGVIAASPIAIYLFYNPITFSGNAAESMKDMGFEPRMYASLDPNIAFVQALIILVISIVLCLYPILKLKFLKPVEAMRN